VSPPWTVYNNVCRPTHPNPTFVGGVSVLSTVAYKVTSFT